MYKTSYIILILKIYYRRKDTIFVIIFHSLTIYKKKEPKQKVFRVKYYLYKKKLDKKSGQPNLTSFDL